MKTTRRGLFGFLAGAAALAAVPVQRFREFGGMPVKWVSEDELRVLYPDVANSINSIITPNQMAKEALEQLDGTFTVYYQGAVETYRSFD